jgi:hypothetical protein
MPVSVPYTFTQTNDSLELRAQLTGSVSKATLDVQGQSSLLRFGLAVLPDTCMGPRRAKQKRT